MARPVSNPTRNPRASEASLDRSRFHYVKIQRDSKDYESPMEQYLDRLSPVDPTRTMYEVASEDRAVTGSSKMVLLRCPIEDHVADLTAIVKEAGARQEKVAEDEKFGPISSE